MLFLRNKAITMNPAGLTSMRLSAVAADRSYLAADRQGFADRNATDSSLRSFGSDDNLTF